MAPRSADAEGARRTAEWLSESTLARLRARLVELEDLVVRLRGEAAERAVSSRLLLLESAQALRELQQRSSDDLAAREKTLRQSQDAIDQLSARLRDVQAELEAYSKDKELYVATLREELRWARRLGLYGILTLARRVVRGGRWRASRALARLLPGRLRAFLAELRQDGHLYEGASNVTVFHVGDDVFQHYPRGRAMRTVPADAPPVQVSLVVTVRNEGRSTRSWLDQLVRGTRWPDELIVIDGGSTDETLPLLQEFAREAPFPVDVVAAGPVNIARGKNLGIARARHPIIAHTDFGCSLEPSWLEYLVRPYQIDPEIEVVSGWYEAQCDSTIGKAAALELVPRLDAIDPQTFIPSTRSVAFRKDAWQRVGGYPEWLTLTGDDTYFGLELKRACRKWAFVPEAKVGWHAPETLRDAAKKAYRWAIGDGEAGLHPDRYLHTMAGVASAAALIGVAAVGLGLSFVVPWLLAVPALCGLLLAARIPGLAARRRVTISGAAVVPLWLAALPVVQLARVAGFIKGARRRPEIRARRFAGVSGTTFVLSGVPISDSGGGPRATQMALELLRRGELVVFVNKFTRDETVDLGLQFLHPNLLTYAAEGFDPRIFFERHRRLFDDRRLLAIAEFPLPDFIPALREVRRRGGVTVYDLIDDWTTSLGAQWYSEVVEHAVADLSDVLVASSEPLRQQLQSRTGRQVSLLPNAANLELFNRARIYPRPMDLIPGEFVLCYIGALWGEWFDWDLLRRIALAYPQSSVALIGDYRGQCQNPPPNLHFLGLKPQRDLPSYLSHTDVAIIPWIVSDLTHATSPLKVYEYLAMGKPIVGPPLRALDGVPYVFAARTHEEFIKNIAVARATEIDDTVIEEFIAHNSWAARISELMKLLRRADRQQTIRGGA